MDIDELQKMPYFDRDQVRMFREAALLEIKNRDDIIRKSKPYFDGTLQSAINVWPESN